MTDVYSFLVEAELLNVGPAAVVLYRGFEQLKLLVLWVVLLFLFLPVFVSGKVNRLSVLGISESGLIETFVHLHYHRFDVFDLTVIVDVAYVQILSRIVVVAFFARIFISRSKNQLVLIQNGNSIVRVVFVDLQKLDLVLACGLTRYC